MKVRRRICKQSLWRSHCSVFGGCLDSCPLPPSSVSTGLGISETSHNKLCSVRKGADALKKQMLQSKMVFRLAEPPPRLLTETAGTSESAKPGSEPQPGRSGTPGSLLAAPQPQATSPRNRTSFLRFREAMAPSPPGQGWGCAGRRAARAAESSPRRRQAGWGRPRPGSPASPCRFHH